MSAPVEEAATALEVGDHSSIGDQQGWHDSAVALVLVPACKCSLATAIPACTSARLQEKATLKETKKDKKAERVRCSSVAAAFNTRQCVP